jgi:hypothetical protein
MDNTNMQLNDECDEYDYYAYYDDEEEYLTEDEDENIYREYTYILQQEHPQREWGQTRYRFRPDIVEFFN